MNTIDMSSKALDQRLRTLSGLYKLGVSLKKAKPIGPVVDEEISQKPEHSTRLHSNSASVP